MSDPGLDTGFKVRGTRFVAGLLLRFIDLIEAMVCAICYVRTVQKLLEPDTRLELDVAPELLGVRAHGPMLIRGHTQEPVTLK